jgi:hypothetical protein
MVRTIDLGYRADLVVPGARERTRTSLFSLQALAAAYQGTATVGQGCATVTRDADALARAGHRPTGRLWPARCLTVGRRAGASASSK